MLTFNSIRVIRVHGTQKGAQRLKNRPVRKQGRRLTNQGSCLLMKRIKHPILGHERRNLV